MTSVQLAQSLLTTAQGDYDLGPLGAADVV
jgi:hypothetical protein